MWLVDKDENLYNADAFTKIILADNNRTNWTIKAFLRDGNNITLWQGNSEAEGLEILRDIRQAMSPTIQPFKERTGADDR